MGDMVRGGWSSAEEEEPEGDEAKEDGKEAKEAEEAGEKPFCGALSSGDSGASGVDAGRLHGRCG